MPCGHEVIKVIFLSGLYHIGFILPVVFFICCYVVKTCGICILHSLASVTYPLCLFMAFVAFHDNRICSGHRKFFSSVVRF